MKLLLDVAAGLGIFIYGMTLMGEGLQKAAGQKLKSIVGALTKSTLRGILVGTLITCIIQSSSATTVMVVGFVNAKIMTLSQAIGVIMGANIGTTMTGFIIALNLTKYAPIMILIGMVLYVAGKNKSTKSKAQICLGLGLLFMGIKVLEGGLKPLAGNEVFTRFITQLENPFFGLLIGIVITTILQSSSAAIGVLQALGFQGLITYGAAMPVVLGSNIGSTTTALISSFGAHKTAKRAALVHLLFNLIGSLIFLTLFILLKDKIINLFETYLNGLPTQIAIGHLIFNIISTLIFFPLTKALVKITEKIIPGSDNDDQEVTNLDRRMLTTPSIALAQAADETKRMGTEVLRSLSLTQDMMLEEKYSLFDKIMEREATINKMEKEITRYLVELSHSTISTSEHKMVDDLLYAINDIERVGDHIKNIAELSTDMMEENLRFTGSGKDELKEMFEKCYDAFKLALESYFEQNTQKASLALKLEEEVDNMEEKFRNNHIKRLANKYCDAMPGIVFLDCISNLERVSDHANNIATYTLDRK